MLLTLLPYLQGFARQTAAWRFSGFVFGVEDGNSYIAKMLQGHAGAWLYRLPYSSEPQRGALIHPYYLLLGKLAVGPGALHGQLLALFQLARLGSGFVMLLATYRFLAEFLPAVGARRIGLLLAALGGGLGWLLALLGREGWLGSLPLDFYSPETFGFLTLNFQPSCS
ncbi:MAG: hypothetical protein HY784_02125 [Chloroflexi bacterium]|nr:hypothetical protein [Chloroflexota bacterium]